jgi:hypothetical protein
LFPVCKEEKGKKINDNNSRLHTERIELHWFSPSATLEM